MNNISIRKRIIILFVCAMILIMGITYILIYIESAAVMENTLSEYLMSAVDQNVDMLKFITSEDIEEEKASDLDDLYLEYGTGYIRIDDDFLQVLNDVECALYDYEGNLLYGDNPMSRELEGEKCVDSRLYKKKNDNVQYIVYDRKFTKENLDGLWIRGVVSMTRQQVQLKNISQSVAAFIPMLLIIVFVVGVLASGSILDPIRQMIKTAESIADADDLHKRLDLPKNKDEMYNLAVTYNNMFDRLEKSFEREKQFTSDASHELRTPLAVIMAQSDYALSKEREVLEYITAFEIIDRQGKRMKKLVEDMLGLSRLSMGEDRYKKENVNLSKVIKETCEDMKHIAYKGIKIETDIKEDIYINGNSSLLERMTINLLDNAYKYGKENGTTRVSLDEREEFIIFTVNDDGIGIAKEASKKVFDRFYREDQSRSNSKGYGLGLSLVKEIVSYHNGTIELESIENHGSTFKILIKK